MCIYIYTCVYNMCLHACMKIHMHVCAHVGNADVIVHREGSFLEGGGGSTKVFPGSSTACLN